MDFESKSIIPKEWLTRRPQVANKIVLENNEEHNYILYKNPVQLETLHIVQYLHSQNITFLPNVIIERNYPSYVTELPTILYNRKLYIGIDICIKLYETYSGIDNILEKADEFKRLNPTYTIRS